MVYTLPWTYIYHQSNSDEYKPHTSVNTYFPEIHQPSIETTYHCGYIFARKRVGCVADEHARLTDGTVPDHHALDGLHDFARCLISKISFLTTNLRPHLIYQPHPDTQHYPPAKYICVWGVEVSFRASKTWNEPYLRDNTLKWQKKIWRYSYVIGSFICPDI